MKIKVWFATINHKFGTTTYTAATEAALYRQLRQYVEENWPIELDCACPFKPNARDKRVVSAYFENMNWEVLDVYADVEVDITDVLRPIEKAIESLASAPTYGDLRMRLIALRILWRKMKRS